MLHHSITPSPSSPSPPRSSPDNSSINPTPNLKRKRKRAQRHATVYDAVAGRVDISGFKIPLSLDESTHLSPSPSSYPRQPSSSSHQTPRPPPPPPSTTTAPPLTPSEVLFKRSTAPDRIAEHDIYDATRRLNWSRSPSLATSPSTDEHASEHNAGFQKQKQTGRARRRRYPPEAQTQRRRRRLPGGELLRAVHEYAALFYAAVGTTATTTAATATATTAAAELKGSGSELDLDNGGQGEAQTQRQTRRNAGNIDTASLDETALLAFGVLVEEAVESLLGDGGEGVFVEGQSACQFQDEEGEEDEGQLDDEVAEVDD